MDWTELSGDWLTAAIGAAVACTAALLAWMLSRWCKHTASRTNQDASPTHPRYAAADGLGAELSSLTEQMCRRLDDKIQQLQLLLRQADERISQMQQNDGHSAVTGKPDPPAATDAGKSNGTAGPDSPEAPPAVRTDSGPADHHPTSSTAALQPDGAKPLRERFAHVYWLAEAGFDPEQIATKTGMHCGEVELILRLGGQQGDSEAASAHAHQAPSSDPPQPTAA